MGDRKEYREKMSGENSPSYGRDDEKHPVYGKHGYECKMSIPVIRLDTLEVYASATEAGRQLGFNSSKISMVCRGERKTSGINEKGERIEWMLYEKYCKEIC